MYTATLEGACATASTFFTASGCPVAQAANPPAASAINNDDVAMAVAAARGRMSVTTPAALRTSTRRLGRLAPDGSVGMDHTDRTGRVASGKGGLLRKSLDPC